MAAWGATQAKAKFSEMLDKAESEGPQLVRRRKREFYVLTREQRDAMVAAEAEPTPFVSGWDALAPSSGETFDIDFPRLRGKLDRSAGSRKHAAKKSPGTLGEFFRTSPLTGSGLKIKRIQLNPRKIEF